METDTIYSLSSLFNTQCSMYTNYVGWRPRCIASLVGNCQGYYTVDIHDLPHIHKPRSQILYPMLVALKDPEISMLCKYEELKLFYSLNFFLLRHFIKSCACSSFKV